MEDFSLNTHLIPTLNTLGIKYRYINGVYDPMTIIIIHKHFDICRVDMNRDLNEVYNYNVYWFPTNVKNACRLRKQYLITRDLIDDIRRAIDFNFEGENKMNNKMYSKTDAILTYKLLMQMFNKTSIKDVIFNPPATIVLWADGTKTVIKIQEGDIFDPEKGLAMAIAKKALGNNYDYYDVFKKYVGGYEKKQKKG